MLTPAAAVYIAEALAGAPRKRQPILFPRSASPSRARDRSLRVRVAIWRRSLPATPAARLRPRSA
jgi:hypothetical protein